MGIFRKAMEKRLNEVLEEIKLATPHEPFEISMKSSWLLASSGGVSIGTRPRFSTSRLVSGSVLQV